jgi:hypothetical protein
MSLENRVKKLEEVVAKLVESVILLMLHGFFKEETEPQQDYLDCESFVKGRLGRTNMNVANKFGRLCALAGANRGLIPKRIKQPGEYFCIYVNTWPISFLQEVWSANFDKDGGSL